MKTITLQEWNDMPNDFKSIYFDYDGQHPEWKGRKVFITHDTLLGTVLLIEGVSFKFEQGGQNV